MAKGVLKHDFKQHGTIIHCWATERKASRFACAVLYNSISLRREGGHKQKVLTMATDLKRTKGKEIVHKVRMP